MGFGTGSVWRESEFAEGLGMCGGTGGVWAD